MIDLRETLRQGVRELVERSLGDRHQAYAEAQGDLVYVRARLPAIEARAASVLARFDRSPLHPGMTVHAAHARHPEVGAFFASRGLPACPDCAVGADETLEEAAFAEGFDLASLLHRLNSQGP